MRDHHAGALVTIAFGLAIVFIAGDWLVGVFSANPAAMAAYTFLALSFGFSLHGFVHSRERARIDELERKVSDLKEELSDRDVEVAKLKALMASGELTTIGEVHDAISTAMATSRNDPSTLWRS